MAFVKDMNEKPWKIIDEQKNAVFRYKKGTGGSSDPMEVFELCWNDDVITAVVKPNVLNNKEIEYQLRAITIPDALKAKKEEIIGLVTEALDVYGYMGRRDWVDKISLTLSPQINIQ